VWRHKDVKTHNVRTTSPLSCQGCKNLPHTSKARQVKRTQMVPTARFTIRVFATFSDCWESNATKLARERMWGLNENRHQNVINRVRYTCSEGLDILRIWWNPLLLLCFIFKFGRLRPPMLPRGDRTILYIPHAVIIEIRTKNYNHRIN